MISKSLLAKLLALFVVTTAPATFGDVPVGGLTVSSASTGSIAGRVFNIVTGQYLSNARIRVQGTETTTSTDPFGYYRLNNIPSGPVILEVYYTGLDAQQISVDVPAGNLVERNVGLTSAARYGDRSEVVNLDSFVVSSAREIEGDALATNEQRFAANIKNVVATDAFGDVTENNMGEFLKLLPGVTTEYSDVISQHVMVRGLGADLTGVTLDGAAVAQANSGSSRTFQMREVSTSSISRIEVVKVPTPANPADSMGGSINMISKSAFERRNAQLRYRGFVSANSHNFTLNRILTPPEKRQHSVVPGFDFDYTLPFSENFGIVLTGSVSNQYNVQNLQTLTWNPAATGTGATSRNPFFQQVTYVDAPKYLRRKNASLSADWRVTRNSVLSFSAQLGHYQDENMNTNFTVGVGTNAAPASGAGTTRLTYSGTSVSGASGRGVLTPGGSFNHSQNLLRAGNLRYRFDDGTWRIDAAASLSISKNWVRQTKYGHFQSLTIATAQPIRVVFPNITGRGPGSDIQVFNASEQRVDISNINNYELRGASNSPNDVSDELENQLINVHRRLNFLPFPTALQIGASRRVQQRDRRARQETWTYAGINGNRSPAPFLGTYQTEGRYGFKELGVPWASQSRAWKAWQDNPNLFYQTPQNAVSTETYRINNSEYINETISALYAQVEAKLFRSRMTVLTGVRWERTEDQGLGAFYDPAAVYLRNPDGSFIRDAQQRRIRRPEAGAVGSMEELLLTRAERGQRSNRSYDDFYPSLHLTYNVTDNFQVRAAYAKTYGRPNFNEIIPNVTLTQNDVDETEADPSTVLGVINVRNVGLLPWTADNYDLSLEYYTDHGGILTAGVFLKEIENFFGNITKSATLTDLEGLSLDPRYEGWELRTKINAGDARVAGVEFNFRHSLRPLGTWASPFTVFANATKLKLEGEQEANFTNFIPLSVNWGFSYSKKPIVLIARWAYRGETQGTIQPTTWGPNAYQRYARRTTLDLNLEYLPFRKRNLSFFANARNIFNEPVVQTRYGDDTPSYAWHFNEREYGIQYTIGFRGAF